MSKTIPYSNGLEYRTLVSGIIAGSIRSCLECPFEYAKVKLQTGQRPRLQSIYTGFEVLYPRSTLIITSVYVQLDYWRRCTSIMDNKVGTFVASGLTGLFSYWLIWPLEVLKNLTQAEIKGIGSSFSERLRYVYSRYGLRGLYRGVVPGSQGVFVRTGASLSVMLMF